MTNTTNSRNLSDRSHPKDAEPKLVFSLTPTLAQELVEALQASRDAAIEVLLTDDNGNTLFLALDQGCDCNMVAIQYTIDFGE